MAWQDTLNDLRDELAEVRLRRLERIRADDAKLDEIHQEMTQLADSLGIGKLLAAMNATLLEGSGQIESIVSWDQDNEDGDSELDIDEEIGLFDDEDEKEESIASLLTWDEDGDREIAVEVILDEEGISLLVNGVQIRPEPEALQQGLVEAFRDELEL
ncbi:MAG: hypothetical protein BZY81_02225 [SAR202 cluster bacterium Io17-Chloro-G4]|nr:MAG: hypothetical protein BZY81_02225 [SAR202 cluster bacterium Io17-Chloro-G4]